jgi:hypothetical protein
MYPPVITIGEYPFTTRTSLAPRENHLHFSGILLDANRYSPWAISKVALLNVQGYFTWDRYGWIVPLSERGFDDSRECEEWFTKE